MASSRASTSARLRKTFKYPSEEDSSNGSRDEMDEEEQTNLITSLKSQEASSNATYITVFSLLPLSILPAFVFYLFSSSSNGTALILCLLSITSLLVSGFTMKFVPVSSFDITTLTDRPRGVGRPPPLPHNVGMSSTTTTASSTLLPAWLEQYEIQVDPDGPLVKFLPWMNIGICGFLCLTSFLLKGRPDCPEAFWLFLLLPAVMLGMVSVARQSMKELEEGIGGLEKLKYDYRGA